MDRELATAGRGLLRRVRWGNVGQLAALVAAGVLLATAGRGGRAEQPERAVTEPGRVSTHGPETAPKIDKRLDGRVAPRRSRREPPERAPKRPRRDAPEEIGRPAPEPTTQAVPQPVPPQPPEQPPPPEQPQPSPRSGEFTPDPAL